MALGTDLGGAQREGCPLTSDASFPHRPVLPGGPPRRLRAHLWLNPWVREQFLGQSFPREPVPGPQVKLEAACRPLCELVYQCHLRSKKCIPQRLGGVTEHPQCAPSPRPPPLITRLRCNQGPLVRAVALLHFPGPPLIQVLPFAKPWKLPP